MCEDMEEDLSSCTAGIDIWVPLMCLGGDSGLCAGTWRRTHHRALQVWISGLLLCVLGRLRPVCEDMEEDLSSCTAGMDIWVPLMCLGGGSGLCAGHGGGPIIVHCRYGYLGCSYVSWGGSGLCARTWRRTYHRALQVWISGLLLCVLGSLRPVCEDMEEDPSSYTAGMDTVFATVCPGGSSDLGMGIWSRDHHRALQLWIPCLLLCVLEEAMSWVR